MAARKIGRGAKGIVRKRLFCRNRHCEKVYLVVFAEGFARALKIKHVFFLFFVVVKNSACFHPNWSKGTAAIRGTRILNHGRYYWEIHVSHRVFGTRYFVQSFNSTVRKN